MQLGAGSHDIDLLYCTGQVFFCVLARVCLLAFSLSFIIAWGFRAIETMIHTFFDETGRGLDGRAVFA